MKQHLLNRAPHIFVFMTGLGISLPQLYGCKNRTPSTQKDYTPTADNETPVTPLQPISDADKINDSGQEAPVTPTIHSKSYSISDFVFPMTSGTFGSAWCACRNIGTSPHIGQDINSDPEPEISVALSDGKIIDINHDSACGYAVHFQDALGALWIYRHLDKPTVSSGEKVLAGEKLGIHKSYPTSRCGTGAHLHIERRTAGHHPGQTTARLKTCSFGARSCYFDPTLIKESRQVRQVRPSAKSETALNLTQNDTQHYSSASDLLAANERSASQTASALVLHSESTQSDFICKNNHVALRISEPPAISVDNQKILTKIETRKGSKGEIFVSEFSAFLESDKQKLNLCNTESKSECIVSLSIFTRDENGNWWLNAEKNGLRNEIPELTKESALCLPSSTGKILVSARTSRQNLYTLTVDPQISQSGK